MFYLLQQTVQVTGIIGAIFAAIIAIGVLIGVIKGWVWFWREMIKPAWGKFLDGRTTKRELALARFERQWILDHSDKPIFALDKNRQCVFVNAAMCRLLQRDSSAIEGRAWHQFIRDEDRPRTLALWDEAYQLQSPFNAVIPVIVGRKLIRFRVEATPFVFNDKVYQFNGIFSYEDIVGDTGVDLHLLNE